MARKNEFTIQVDKTIGERIHELRISMGLSRVQLADEIGVTHQQLQKYEKGTNRITGGRLAAVALTLKKPVDYFFINSHKEQATFPTQHQRMCIEVSRNFLRIKNPKHQEAVNRLVLELAG